MSDNYPRFTPRAIELVGELSSLLAKDPEALKRPECNFPQNLRHHINQIMLVGALRNTDPSELEHLVKPENNPNTETEIDLDVDVDIETESRHLYNQMKTTMKTISNMDTGEKVQLFRVATQLLEKLLSLQEKAVGVEQFSQFKTYIMRSMDRYLTPVQKSEFVSEIEAILTKNSTT